MYLESPHSVGSPRLAFLPYFFLRLPTQKGSPRHSLCRLLHIDCLNETLIALLFITPICGIIGLSLRIAFKRSFSFCVRFEFHFLMRLFLSQATNSTFRLFPVSAPVYGTCFSAFPLAL